jgi:hypothetical protein
LILGEAPTLAQYIGGSVILCGIVLNQIGISHQGTETINASHNPSDKQMDIEVGFKGI